jgi:polyisoprenoid-binding protein YceI
MKRLVLVIAAALVLASAVFAQDSSWRMDRSHTSIIFSIRHMVISEVVGSFHDFDLKVSAPSEDLAGGTVEAVINVASINTDNERRDNDLRGKNFFDVDQFPQITFKSIAIDRVGDDKYKIHGDLTIRDVTKRVTFDAVLNGTVPSQQGIRSGWKATLAINRFDYGLKWNRTIETGGLIAGETVTITINATFIRPAS